VNGQFRGCSTPNYDQTKDDMGEASVFDELKKMYSEKHLFPIWFRGTPWGEAETNNACLVNYKPGDYIDWSGCLNLHPAEGQSHLPKAPSAIAYTGPTPKKAHDSVRAKANSAERTIFLSEASKVYEEHHVHAAPNSIHVGTVWKTQFQTGHTALVGNTVYQFALKDKKDWLSDRIFLVLEGTNGTYTRVLTDFNREAIATELPIPTPKFGEILDEEGNHDEQVFVDNFPLFPAEPDILVTVHHYYEDWNYSIFRRTGATYREVYIGCGGGD
jgi:hypothetical protein